MGTETSLFQEIKSFDALSEHGLRKALEDIIIICKEAEAGPLGLMGREPAHQTCKPGSNPSWDATVHPVCETLIVMYVV